ncbi:MAG: PAS domain-containing sensor histidine kinase [Janthinobacterium lividum]
MTLAQPPPDLLPVFNALPGANLLLSPEWVIVAASNDYLAATLTQRETIVGQHIFDAFPDNPQAPQADAVANVRAALVYVAATKQVHEMAPQHYDVPDPAQPGQFVERHWLPRHTPILDAVGQVQFILQSVQDITANRLAERQLRESQASAQLARADAEQQRAQFRYFIEQAPVAVAIYRGPQHRIELANATTLAIWDRTLDDVLHRPVFEVLPEAATPEIVGLFERVFTTGITHTAYEQPTFIKRQGRREVVYWSFVFQPQREPDGRIGGIFTIGTEVTEQVRARQQLEQLNQELETRVQERTQAGLALQGQVLAAAERQVQERETFYQVFAQTPACIALLRGPEHRFEYVNAAYQQLFPGRTLVGLPLREALPETEAQGFVAWMNNVYQTGKTFFGTELLLTVEQAESQPAKDVYFTFTYQAYREQGIVAGISIFAYDVTEQVRARQEREAQRQEFEQLFRQAPAPIVILDGPDLVFQLVNPAYQLIFPGRELAGKPLLEALPELVGTPIPELFQHVYQTGEPVTVHEMPLQMARHQGQAPEEIYWTFTYQARRAAHGLIDGVRVFAHDVTEQVRTRQQVQELNEELATINQELAAINEELTATNEELNESNSQLTRTNVDLDNFIYTASHDLKAPIANIEGLLLALEQELPAAGRVGDVPHMLRLMQDATERFRRTIGHLTDVSRLQKEHSPISENVSLLAVIEAVCLDLLPLLEQTQAQLTVQVPASLTLTFPEKNLRSVVYNLLSNALKYRSPARICQVRLSYQPQQDYQVLEVQDNGLGLDLTQGQDKLFAMFQRLHTHVEGTGLGLYMIKRMVENAGGLVEVASQLGQGTTFRVYFRR